MSQLKPHKTYIIRHKKTKEPLVLPSGKASWKKVGHAKSAFGNAAWYPTAKTKAGLDQYGRVPKFDEQDIYEIVEVKPESEERLQRAVDLLKELQGRVDSVGFDMIRDFLQEIENEQEG